MLDSQRFPFTERTDSLGRTIVMPYLPLTLTNGSRSVEVMALLDTGASVNVQTMIVGIVRDLEPIIRLLVGLVLDSKYTIFY